MDQTTTQHDEARIRQRAYEIWLDEGAPSGRSEANWLQAQAELTRAEDAMANQVDKLDTTRSTRRKTAR